MANPIGFLEMIVSTSGERRWDSIFFRDVIRVLLG